MKKLLAIALTASVCGLGVSTAADARAGCGRGFHRGPHGRCIVNRGPGYAVPPRLAIGSFYHGRGYWDGRRYWGHRYRYRGGWRYR